MISLRNYEGKQVLIQLKSPFVVAIPDKGVPTPIMMKVENHEQFVMLPFIIGKVKKRSQSNHEPDDGRIRPNTDVFFVAFEYKNNGVVEVELSDDVIASVSVASEKSMLTVVGAGAPS